MLYNKQQLSHIAVLLPLLALSLATAIRTYATDFNVDDIRFYMSNTAGADVNADGAVDVGDLNVVLSEILVGGTKKSHDVNRDGKVDVGDVNAILTVILTPGFHNNPLPTGKDKLRVLAIGNSHVHDALMYMSSFLTAAGIKSSKVCFYGLYKSNCSLQIWDEIYNAGDALSNHNVAYCRRYAGSINMGIDIHNSLAEILAKDWDVVVLQQFSLIADDYTTFNPYLANLMRHTLELCPNRQVAFAWQSAWSCTTGYKGAGDDEHVWRDICAVTQKMVDMDGIDIIIPSGTALQNARNTTLGRNHNGELMRDGLHLCYGAGRYVVTATWFETLVAPMFGVSVLGSTAVHETAEGASTYDFVAVDDSNRELLQRCAVAAIANPWTVTKIAE